jgi:hypothetical protein
VVFRAEKKIKKILPGRFFLNKLRELFKAVMLV